MLQSCSKLAVRSFAFIQVSAQCPAELPKCAGSLPPMIETNMGQFHAAGQMQGQYSWQSGLVIHSVQRFGCLQEMIGQTCRKLGVHRLVGYLQLRAGPKQHKRRKRYQ